MSRRLKQTKKFTLSMPDKEMVESLVTEVHHAMIASIEFNHHTSEMEHLRLKMYPACKLVSNILNNHLNCGYTYAPEELSHLCVELDLCKPHVVVYVTATRGYSSVRFQITIRLNDGLSHSTRVKLAG